MGQKLNRANLYKPVQQTRNRLISCLTEMGHAIIFECLPITKILKFAVGIKSTY